MLANPYRASPQPGSPSLAEHATLGQHYRLSSADSRLKMVQKSNPSAPISAPLGKPLKRSFFDRSVHEVAPDLIGATLLVNGVGGIIVEVEAYHHTDPAAHSFRGPTPRNRVMFGPARLLLRLSFLRHPLVRELCLRGRRLGQRRVDPCA